MSDLQRALAYVNRIYKKLSGEIALKADAGESVDLSNIYTKTEVNALIPSVPTQLSQLSEDTTHRTVTDIEKTTWNAKANALGADDNYVTDLEKAKIANIINFTYFL